MRILDKYILKSVLGVFFGCLITFIFLYIVIDILSHLEVILKQEVSFSILKQYYLSFLPIIFVQVTPIACLLSTLYTFAKLNNDNEIIAMRASGMSILQVTKTVIIFGIFISTVIFWLNDKTVPQSLIVNERIKNEIENDTKKPTKEKTPDILRNLTMYGSNNSLYFINKFTTATNTMDNILILEHDEHQNLDKKIVANSGIYEDGKWKFFQSITYRLDDNGQIIGDPQYLEEEIMNIPEKPDDFISQKQHTDYMTVKQLRRYVRKLSKSGSSRVVKNLKVDLYQRYLTPLTSLIIMLLGIPFAMKIKKRATGMSSLGLSIMMGFLYYVLNAVSIALGKSGILIPILSASLSHILAFSLSCYLIKHLP